MLPYLTWDFWHDELIITELDYEMINGGDGKQGGRESERLYSLASAKKSGRLPSPWILDV